MATAAKLAKGEGNIFLVTPFPNALAGATDGDLKFLWKSPSVNERWRTVVKHIIVTTKPVRYIKPWAKTAITCYTPLAIMALSRQDAYAGLYSVPGRELWVPSVEDNPGSLTVS